MTAADTNIEKARTFSLREIVDYCKGAVEWDDVKGIVAMLNKLLRRTGTEKELGMVDSIEREFCMRRYGNMFPQLQLTGFSPYESLLRKMIDAVRESGNWKDILCPYRAAVDEGVLPKWSHKQFVGMMDISVPASRYSEYMNPNANPYVLEEIEPYASQFKQLKHQFETQM